MKNILFIGPYRQKDGWGHAAREYIKMLSLCDCNLAIRPVYMSSSIGRPESHLFDCLEAVQYPHYDIIIQNVLPHLTEYYPGSKNVALVDIETNNLKHTAWPRFLNNMDEVWVDTKREVNCLTQSGCVKPVKQISMPIDLSKFDIEIDKKAFGSLKDSFNFLFMGEYITRKNLPVLIKAFHREFSRKEDIVLIIKTSLGGLDSQELIKKVAGDVDKIKKSLRLFHSDRYLSEFLIADFLSEPELYGLHSVCNSFVMPSCGESACLPLMDSMYFGNIPIVTANTGMETIVGDSGYLIKSREVPVYCTDPPMHNLYTSRETWMEADVESLQELMRKATTAPFSSASLVKEQLNKFSHQSLLKEYNELIS